ncbi:MAG: FG-GAP repeat protein, partial [Planctomycetota bacterium]
MTGRFFTCVAVTAAGIFALCYPPSAWGSPRDTRSVCQTSVLTADDGAAGDLLGISAAIGGDYAFLGALSGDTDTVFNCGTVYVFRRDGVGWVQHDELFASDAAFSDDFGNSVSAGGDLLVVGAPRGEIPGTSNIGAVYVFKRTGQNWTEQAQLVAGQFYREAGARFGEAVALDAEPPGGARLIVGASDRTVDFKKTGEVYFFEHQGTDVWETMGFAQAATTGDGDKFGSVVGISGDWAIVGAPKTDDECPLNNTCDSGSAFVYRYTGSA